MIKFCLNSSLVLLGIQFTVIPIISITKNPSRRIINGTFLSKRTRLKPSNKVVFIGFWFKIDTGLLQSFKRALVGFYSWKISVFYIVFHLAIQFCSNTIFFLQHLFINFSFCLLNKNLLNLRGY